jgi:hypothetical protein
MALLSKHVKTPEERKRYIVNYDDWLDIGEILATSEYDLTPVTTPALTVANITIMAGGRNVLLVVGDGKDGETYELIIRSGTSLNQIKEDYFVFVVREIDAV